MCTSACEFTCELVAGKHTSMCLITFLFTLQSVPFCTWHWGFWYVSTKHEHPQSWVSAVALPHFHMVLVEVLTQRKYLAAGPSQEAFAVVTYDIGLFSVLFLGDFEAVESNLVTFWPGQPGQLLITHPPMKELFIYTPKGIPQEAWSSSSDFPTGSWSWKEGAACSSYLPNTKMSIEGTSFDPKREKSRQGWTGRCVCAVTASALQIAALDL